jgi:hypothetical protein
MPPAPHLHMRPAVFHVHASQLGLQACGIRTMCTLMLPALCSSACQDTQDCMPHPRLHAHVREQYYWQCWRRLECCMSLL